ncbi:NAD(+) synthase [Desulfuromonas acetoxidans]|uniref:NAD(+) synthase n=1 Tax=Desulfuromonas acetoxidans TaxID=891 RepID=UPI00292DCF94|nr:NAD(+) synthase [Desulfuromonas acetoxidans]
MNKTQIARFGYFRLAVASVEHRIADLEFNAEQITSAALRAKKQGCHCVVFPELSLTGYGCGDLFFQSILLERTRQVLGDLKKMTRHEQMILIVGAPIAQGGRLFNCAVVISGGEILGVVPKNFLPNTQEFYEERWFSAAADRTADEISLCGAMVPFGDDLLFRQKELPGCVLGVEICEDGWVANPPSGQMAVAGATVLVNLSASPEILGKQDYRRQLVQSQSARCLAAYAYASAGPGESSTDLVFSGHSLIAENGQLLAETERFSFATQLAIGDVDIDRLYNERHKNNSFAASSAQNAYRKIEFNCAEHAHTPLHRPLPCHPFVPANLNERDQRCEEIFALQTTALAKRLNHIGVRNVVIGISGGLDSTLALLVTVKAFEKLDLDPQGITAVTMPGFGTTTRTRGNAESLIDLLGAQCRIISIDAAVRQHFADIGHDESVHNITYENSQARERTQLLMDIANQVGGIVIGTGDLSELALGWCTYNADHMSMYGVNCGVPKTLVRYLVSWCAQASFCGETRRVLEDICATPVSPELLPPDEAGEISQVTEDHVGPYELHDFYLFQVVRHQFAPRKVFFLARQAFAERYDDATLLKWLQVFYRRFFSQQFKRSCLPDGPKVGSVALSPRGDWRMPSDACVQLWLDELEGLHVG